MTRETLLGTIACVALMLGGVAAGDNDCAQGRLSLVFQELPLNGPGHETPEIGANAADEITALYFGETARATVYGAIVSELNDSGVQAWSLTGRTVGEITAVDITTAGTAAALAPDGLRASGFESSDVWQCERPDGRFSTFASAVILAFTRPITLKPRGTATVLALTVESTEHASSGGRVEWGGFPCIPGAQPMETAVTVSGDTHAICEMRPVTIDFAPDLRPRFRRGDANGDDRVDISDAVTVFMYLFIGGREPRCLDAADARDTGKIDITDGIFILLDFFRDGTGISSPGPFGCGPDPTEDRLDCASYESCE